MRKLLIWIWLALTTLHQALGAPPPNDLFTDAKLLDGESISDTSNNASATTDVGEPSSSGLKTLWWTYRPNAIGRLTISTTGSDDFGKVIAVYLGTNLASLRLVADSAQERVPSLSLPVTADTDYQISVGSAPLIVGSGQGGRIVLGFSLDSQADVSSFNIPYRATVTNDAFANRVLLTGNAVGSIGYNTSASNEATASEPTFSGLKTLWWTYRPSANGRLTVSTTGSDDFAKVVAVYLGTNLASLRLVADSAQDFERVPSLSFPVTMDTDYQISVGSDARPGGNGQGGSIVIGFSLDSQADVSNYNLPVQAAAANDAFVNRVALSGSTVSAIGYNTAATREPLEPTDPTTYERTIWWTWTAPAAGNAIIELTGSDSIQKAITVWRGESLSSLKLVATSASTLTSNPKLTFISSAGETYQIAVGNTSSFQGAGGSVVLTIAGPTGSPGSALPSLVVDRAVHIRWFAIAGMRYQVQSTSDSKTWTNVGELIAGDGSFKNFFDVATQPESLYRVFLQP